MIHDQTRLPPQDLDAERGTLGSILLYGELYADVGQLLVGGDFYLDAHTQIFAACGRLHKKQVAIDAVTVADELQRFNKYDEIGGQSYLLQILDAVPHAAHAQHYAGIVREKAKRRALIYAAGQMMVDGYESVHDADTLLQEADSTIVALMGDRCSNEPVTCARAMADLLNELDQQKPAATRIPTGLHEVDSILAGGIPAGSLAILGAATSVGKSAMAGNNIAPSGAAHHHTLIISREMPAREYFGRIAVSQSSMTRREMEEAVAAGDTQAMIDHIQRISGLPISVDDTSRIFADVQTTIRRSVRKHATKLVIIDYLQLLVPNDRRVPRHEQIGQMTGGLKQLAIELDIAVVALSQLSRAANERGVRPQLHHLRESGSIEQDADIAMLLSRDEGATEATLHIAKQRGGKTGVVQLAWIPQLCRFESITREWYQSGGSDDLDGNYS